MPIRRRCKFIGAVVICRRDIVGGRDRVKKSDDRVRIWVVVFNNEDR
jgi:hypothetical protein